MSPVLFDIDASDIAALDDTQLRELIRRLCAAELRRHGLPLSALTFGGDQDAPDGGIDGRVTLPDDSPALDFIPRPKTGFQAKRTNITAGKVANAMRLKGKLYPSILALGEAGGAYVIVSGKASATDRDLTERIDAMKAAMGDAKAPVLDFYDGPRIAGWVNDHPGVALWVRQVLGQPLSFWKPWGNWSNPAAGTLEEFIKDDKALITDSRHTDHPLDAETGMARLREILRKPKGIVRLIGLSGTGKTRLAQALFELDIGGDPLPEDWAVYTDLGDSPKPTPQEVIPRLAALGRPVVLVIDNCPPATHKSLADQVRGAGGRISLLTIEYDVSDGDAEGMEVFRLDTASPEVIERLLAARHPLLSQLDRRRITELAGNNSRLALAVADAAPKGSLSSLTDSDLFKRLFWQRDQPDQNSPMQRAAEICSLVYSFEVEKRNEENAELPILAGLARMDVEDLYRHVATLLRRQLAQKRDVWRAVLPHVLANRLAGWALENTNLKLVVPALINHPRLRTSFARRLSFLHKSGEAKSIVTGWLAPGSWLGDIAKLDGQGWTHLRLIAPVAPEEALRRIEAALDSPDSSNLLSDRALYRHAAIRLLAALAYEAELFERAAFAIAQFVPFDGENGNHDSARNTLKRLFQVFYSGTRADMDLRLALLDRLVALGMDEAAHHALGGMLKAWNFSTATSMDFGGRSRSYGWEPGTEENLRRWWMAALNRAEALAHSGGPAWARPLLVQHFRELWCQGKGIPEHLTDLFLRLSAEAYWPEAWASVRLLLRDRDESEAEDPALNALEAALAPKNLEQRITAYALTDQHGAIDIADSEEDDQPMSAYLRVERMVEDLGAELVAQPELLAQMLPRICSTARGRTFSLGRGLVRGTNDQESLWQLLLGGLLSLAPTSRNYVVLGGFLKAAAEMDSSFGIRCLDHAQKTPALCPMLPYLQGMVAMDQAGVERLIEAARSATALPHLFHYLRLGNDDCTASEEAVLTLIEAVAHLPDHGPRVAVSMLTEVITAKKAALSKTLLGYCGDFLRHHPLDTLTDYHSDYQVGKIVKVCLEAEGGLDVAKVLAPQIAAALAEFRNTDMTYREILASLQNSHPHVLLDSLLVAVDRWGNPLRRILDFNDASSLSRMPKDIVLSWADLAPVERYPLVGRLFNLFAGDGTPNPIMLHLIENAPDRPPVLDAMSVNLGPSGGSVEGLIALYDSRAQGMKALFNHPHEDVRQWARTMAQELQASADMRRRTLHQRNERFE